VDKNTENFLRKAWRWFRELNTLSKILVTILVLYVASPVDFMPGPVDDIAATIVLLIGTFITENVGLE
jgi:hypothetical protein